MNPVVEIESLAIELLIVVSLVALAVNRLRVPYVVALVLVGLALTFRQDFKAEITPDLILALFIPPVAFEAAFHIEVRHLRENLVQILGLATLGVVVTTVIIGGTVSILSPEISPAAAIVFGALISATDPVAVIALFKSSNIARRLSILVEGESLLNDGTAIVVFNIALVAAASGLFDPVGGLLDFVRVAAGGVAIGSVVGWFVARLLAQIDDYLVETTLTTCLAFGSYLLAEQLHTSGVLAVVAAGLFCGSVGTRGMSPTTRIVVSNFWEYIAFLANSIIFLLIGLTINISQLASYAGPIAAAIGAVLLSRAIIVYGQAFLLRGTRYALPASWQHVQFWGGLRGAVSIALALSLPTALASRDTLRIMTFGVVLFTLVVQTLTMPSLLKRLGLGQRSARKVERDMRLGRIYAAQAAWRRLQAMHTEGILTGEVWAGLQAQHRQERERLNQEMQALYREYGELEQEIVVNARQESLQAERAALNEALQHGLISVEAFQRLTAEVDRRIDAIRLIAQMPGSVESGSELE